MNAAVVEPLGRTTANASWAGNDAFAADVECSSNVTRGSPEAATVRVRFECG